MSQDVPPAAGVPFGVVVPEACTLPTAEQPLRLAEFDELFATGVRDVTRPGPLSARLALRPDPELAARAADLVVRETRCCSFFTFALTATGGELSLEVTVPEAYADVLDSLARRAAGAAA